MWILQNIWRSSVALQDFPVMLCSIGCGSGCGFSSVLGWNTDLLCVMGLCCTQIFVLFKKKSFLCYICRSHDECYVVGTGETEGGGYGSGVGHWRTRCMYALLPHRAHLWLNVMLRRWIWASHSLCTGTIKLCGHNAVIIYSFSHHARWRTAHEKHDSFMSLLAALNLLIYGIENL